MPARSRQLERRAMRLGGYDQPAVPPPIPPPSVPGIIFLDTVGAILEEGVRMLHCIATRADAALHGQCYLFHIEYGGQLASVEVSAKGEIADARGPHNADNAAAWWGAAQLRNWAAEFVAQSVPSVDLRQLHLPL